MTRSSKPRAFTPETVRMVRQGLNLSQESFARLMGVSRRTVIRWERGQHLPPSWHHKWRGKQHRRKFFRLWDKHERWLEHVGAVQRQH